MTTRPDLPLYWSALQKAAGRKNKADTVSQDAVQPAPSLTSRSLPNNPVPAATVRLIALAVLVGALLVVGVYKLILWGMG